MKTGYRRVISFETKKKVYNVYSPKKWIDSYAYIQTCQLFTFDEQKALDLANQLGVHYNTFDGNKIDFTQKHIQRLLK